jgi:hypothetical protein
VTRKCNAALMGTNQQQFFTVKTEAGTAHTRRAVESEAEITIVFHYYIV